MFISGVQSIVSTLKHYGVRMSEDPTEYVWIEREHIEIVVIAPDAIKLRVRKRSD